MMEGFIHNQNMCLVGGGVIPGCSSRNHRDIQQWLDGLVMCACINTPGGVLDDGEVIAKAACVGIGIGFIC